MRLSFLFLLFSFAPFLGTQTYAGEAIIYQDELIVSATGIPTPLHETGTRVDIITAQDLTRQQITHLGDALRTTGINIAQSGGVGTQSNVFLRGLAGRYTNLIIDGISFFDVGANQVVWNDVLTQGLGRIEVVRGSHGVLYGSNAVAGVVVADTRIGGATNIILEGEGGSFATWRSTVSASGTINSSVANSDYGFSLGYFNTAGISAAEENSGNGEEDGHSNFTTRGRIKTTLTDTLTLEVAGYSAVGNTEYDSGFPLADSSNEEDFTRFAARLGIDYAGEIWAHKLAVQHYDSDVEESDNIRKRGSRKSASTRINYEGSLVASLIGDNNIRLAWGADHISNRFENTTQNFSGAPNFVAHDNETYGLYGIGHFTPLEGLAITAAARYDEHELFDGHATWRLSAAYRFNNRLTLRGLYATGYRAPSLFELFADNFGNRDLKPEESQSREIGVDVNLTPHITTSLTAFNIKVDDLIGYDPTTFQNVQIRGRTHSQGLEVAINGKWRTIEAKFNLAYSDSRQPNASGVGADIRGVRVPRWQTHITLDYTPNDKISLGASLHHARDTTDIGNIKLDDYYLLGVRVRYQLTPSFSIYARGENLLDDDYQVVNGYGTAGSSGTLGFRLAF